MINYDKDFQKVMNKLSSNYSWFFNEPLSDYYNQLLNDTIRATKEVNANELIKSLGEPVEGNEYTIKPDKDGIWYLDHNVVGSGEPLKQFLKNG